MKKRDHFILFLLFCYFVLSSNSIFVSATPIDSTVIIKSDYENYSLSRSVIGSGGIIGAQSQNYIHHGTAGQPVIGGVQSADNTIISGFWTLPNASTEISMGDKQVLPTVFALHQNYPNPFNPETTIEYDLPEACYVVVEIFNTVGQRIRFLSSNLQSPGYASIVWDGRDDQGQTMVSAVYIYRITAFAANNDSRSQSIQFQQTKKMLLIK